MQYNVNVDLYFVLSQCTADVLNFEHHVISKYSVLVAFDDSTGLSLLKC